MHLKYSVACVHIPVCLLWLRMAFFFFFFCFLSLLFNFHVKHTGCSLAQSASPPSLNSSIWTATGHDCDPQSGNFSHLPQNGNQFRFDTVYLKVNSWNTAVDGTELSTSPLVELWDNHPKKTFCTSSKLLSLVFFFFLGGGGADSETVSDVEKVSERLYWVRCFEDWMLEYYLEKQLQRLCSGVLPFPSHLFHKYKGYFWYTIGLLRLCVSTGVWLLFFFLSG